MWKIHIVVVLYSVILQFRINDSKIVIHNADIAKLLKFLLDRSPIKVKKNNFYIDFIVGLSLDW